MKKIFNISYRIYSQNRNFFLKLCLIVLLALGAGEGWGQILTFEFSALVGDEVTATSNTNDANLSSSTISRGAGLTAAANGGRFNATNWALTSIANAVTGNNYMEFTITPSVGYQFSVSSIFFQMQRSSTGNTAIALRSSVDGYTTDLDAVKAVADVTTTQTFTFTFAQANSAVAVTYRLYSYAEATSGSGGIGDGAGNDIIVNGSVTSTGGGNDADSQVSAGAGSEPATIASTIDTDGERILVFDVTFTDLATADGLAAIIDQIVFTQGSANGVADWTNAIAGAKLCGPDLACAVSDLVGTIGATTITFSGVDFISIADGANETYQLKIWLNTDLSGITDNDILEFKLDFSNITCDVLGSSFGSGTPESGDANVSIDIDATKLNFTTAPSTTVCPVTNFPTPPVVTARDANNNTDVDFTNTVTITNSGTLSMTNFTMSAVAGVANFSTLQFTQGGSVTLSTTNGGGLTNAAATASITIAASDVTGEGATSGNTQVSVAWSNPSCYDEIMIVAKTSTISGTPTGDGSAYTANSLSFTDGANTTFDGTGKVIYKGTTSPQVVTSLTNGTLYYFRLYTRKGSVWNAGVEVSATPVAGPCLSESAFTARPAGWAGTSDTYVAGEANFASNTGELSTLSIANPASLDFDLRRTTNTTAKTLYVEVSTTTQGGTYTTVATYDHSNTTSGGTTACTVDLSAYTGSGTVFIKFRKASATTSPWYLDNVSVTCGSACTPPSTQASATSTNTPTVDGFSISWTAGDGDGTMLVVRPTAQSNTLPSSGTSYTGNLAWGSAQQIDANNRVVFKAVGTSAGPVTGLTAETQYTITSYEYATTGDCYNTTSPISTTRYTLSTEPTAQPGAGLSSTTCTANSIDLTIPAPSAGADGYIVLQKTGSAPTGLPTDGNSYNVSDAIGDATVAASVTSSGTIVISGLSASTNYFFIIVPFNANASSTAQTFNYYTGGTLLQTNFSTLASGASNASTVETDATYSYTQNIAYASYQSTPVPAAAGSSVGVHNIIIKDGGGASDADGLETILTDISYTYTGTANTVRAAALFTTSGSKVADATSVGANSITFTGLSGANVTAADNSNTELILRVTFAATVTDNEKLVFTVSSVTAGSNCSYSQFANADGGGAVSDNGANDRNKIEVTADRLVFSQQPSTTSINTAMSPNPTVSAVDANSNVDKDFTTAISVTSTGTMAGSPVSGTWSNGVATFSNLTHTVAGTGLTLTATTSGLAFDNDVVSGIFDITEIVYVSGDYRTLGSGTWLSNTADGLWEKYNGTAWAANNSPTFATTSNIYIQNGHTITTGGSFGSSVDLKILDGGIFNCNHPSTTASIYVYANGHFNINAALTNNGSFTIEDNGFVNLAYTGGASTDFSSTLWAGTEAFSANSYFTINDLNNVSFNFINSNTDVSTTTVSGYSAMFGNLIIDMALATMTTSWSIFGNSPLNVANNLTHKDLIFRSSTASIGTIRISSTGIINTSIGRDLITEIGFSSTINNTTTGDVTLNIKGNITHGSGTALRVITTGSSAAGLSGVFHVDGNISLTGGSTLSMNATSGSTTAVATINLKGDISVDATSLLENVNSTTLVNTSFNFNGTADGTTSALTQEIDIATTLANENRYIPFNVNSGTFVRLINRNFELGTGSSLNVKDGAIFDFGFNGATALIVTEVPAGATSTAFDLDQGGTLKITSPDGLHDGTTLTIGNIQQLAISDRTIDQTATFWYIGKANQVTGNAITSGSTAKIVIVELLDNTVELSLTNCLAVSDGTTLSASGGKLDIRKGILRETTTEYFSSCSGTLYMTDGKYIIALNSSSSADLIPRMEGATHAYSLTGGTVELAGTNIGTTNQYLRGGRNYYSLTFSGGANKWVSSAITQIGDDATINTGLVTIEDDNTILDVENNSFSGNAALTMTDVSLFRMSKLNETLPELLGTYTMTGGTVELYGTSSAQTHSFRGTDGSSATITYNNVELNSTATNVGADAANVVTQAGFNVNGTMNVNIPVCFKVGSGFTIGGTGTFNVIAGSTLKYGSATGITTSPTASGNIQTTTRTFPTTASYGFCGGVDQVSGSGLPTTIVNLYVDKTNDDKKGSLTDNLTTSSDLVFTGGKVELGVNNLTVTGSITGEDNTQYVISNTDFDDTPKGFLIRNVAAVEKEFPIGTVNGSYTPCYITNSGTARNFSIRVFPGVYEHGISGSLMESPIANFVNRTWEITPDGASVNAQVKLQWNAGEEGSSFNRTVIHMIKNLGGGSDIWDKINVTAASASGTYEFAQSGITTFSKFTIGDAEAPLPIELLYFSAEHLDRKVILYWSTASETNNDYFTLEKSKDGISFNPFSKVDGAGNSNSTLNYSAIDNNPLNGISYYRLKQTDFDGKYSYSNIVSVYIENQEIIQNLWYNKDDNKINIEINSTYSSEYIIIAYDICGKQIINKKAFIDGKMNLKINTDNIPSGIYTISIISDYCNFNKKIVIITK